MRFFFVGYSFVLNNDKMTSVQCIDSPDSHAGVKHFMESAK